MKDLVVSAIAFVLLAGANLVTGVLAARLLGPVGRGELAAILLWPQLLASLGVALVVDAIVQAAATRSAPMARIFATGQALGLAVSLPLMALAGTLVWLLNSRFRAEVVETSYLYILIVPMIMLATFANGMFQGSLRFVTWNAMRILAAFLYLGCVLAVWAFGAVSVESLALASLVGAVLTYCLLATLIGREGWFGWRPDRALMRGFVTYGLPIAGGSTLLVMGERLDQVLISQWESEANFGFYIVGASLAGAASGVVGLLGAIALPRVAAQTDAAARAAVFGRFLRVTAVAVSIIAVTLALLAPLLIEILYGRAFLDAVPVVRILALGAVPYGLKQLLVQGAKAYDRTRAIGRIETVTVIASVLALATLVPILGIRGAAWSFVVAQSAGTAMAVWHARNIYGVAFVSLMTPRAEDWRNIQSAVRAWRS